MEVKNSSGYFKDPVTFADLTVDMPREVAAAVTEEGKFIWPLVKVSDGSLVKIVYKLFTDEEKALYKEYRSHDGKRKTVRQSKKPEVSYSPSGEDISKVPDEIAYDDEAAGSAHALALIASCDRIIGVSQIAGLTYAMLTCNGSNKIYYVPRRLIDNDNMYRLSGNEVCYD